MNHIFELNVMVFHNEKLSPLALYDILIIHQKLDHKISIQLHSVFLHLLEEKYVSN